MPGDLAENRTDDGVLGIDALNQGVWKINLAANELSFASSADSFPEIAQCEVFPSAFSKNAIHISVDFGKGLSRNMAIDLGYKGDMLVPPADFEKIVRGTVIPERPVRFISAAGERLVSTRMFFDTLRINGQWFIAQVSTNEAVNERLTGLSFFRRSKYMIFDFIGQRIYVPKKVW